LIQLFQHPDSIHLMPIRRRTILSSTIAIHLILLLFYGCGTRQNNELKHELVRPALNQVYTLYELIGQSELDSITSAYNILHNYIIKNDSPENLSAAEQIILLDTRNNLAKYIEAFDEFHEEIFTVEDHLLFLESSFVAGKMDENTFKERIDEEILLLQNVESRIRKLRKQADSTIYFFQRKNIPL
jgi:hypothetical protein